MASEVQSKQKTYTNAELTKMYNDCTLDYNEARAIIERNVKEKEELIVALNNIEKLSKQEKRQYMLKGFAIGAGVVCTVVIIVVPVAIYLGR